MQKQVDGVITGRIPSSQPLVEPKGRIREGTNRERAPQGGRKQGVIVEMKRAPQAAAKCDDSGEKENNGLARNDSISVTKTSAVQGATPRKLVPRPKNAAERAARVKSILTLLDDMFTHPPMTLHLRNPWQLLAETVLSAK